jgi:catechol 2,3-dioxygenase-like lactoylglutathione lyase family enzyme
MIMDASGLFKTARPLIRSVTCMAPTFNAFGLVVAEMATTLAFYRELGLDIPAEADAAPHAEVALGGGLRLLFDTHETIRSFDPDFAPSTSGGQFGVAFSCDGPADVDGTYDRMVAAGHRGHKKPWDAFWGQRYAVLLDPDGNHVDLYAALP